MKVVHTIEELRAQLRGQLRVSFVPTMGNLHEGHLALMKLARHHGDPVVASIFVNRMQFGPNEDFDKYPRTLAADLEACRAEQVDLVFAPDRDEMYPGGSPLVTLNAGPVGELLEGASRPGHFSGMLTVVAKLLRLTRADLAFFGEKDFQQLALITRMVQDLELAVEIIGVPTVRETDGLALSSRNRYLSAGERQAALALSHALREGAAQTDAESVLEAAGKILADEPGVRVDYLALTNPLLGPAPTDGPARLLVAAKVGTTRLIDNVPVLLGRAA